MLETTLVLACLVPVFYVSFETIKHAAFRSHLEVLARNAALSLSYFPPSALRKAEVRLAFERRIDASSQQALNRIPAFYLAFTKQRHGEHHPQGFAEITTPVRTYIQVSQDGRQSWVTVTLLACSPLLFPLIGGWEATLPSRPVNHTAAARNCLGEYALIPLDRALFVRAKAAAPIKFGVPTS